MTHLKVHQKVSPLTFTKGKIQINENMDIKVTTNMMASMLSSTWTTLSECSRTQMGDQ